MEEVIAEEAMVAAAVTAGAAEVVSAEAAEPAAAVEEEDKQKGCPRSRKHPFLISPFLVFYRVRCGHIPGAFILAIPLCKKAEEMPVL